MNTILNEIFKHIVFYYPKECVTLLKLVCKKWNSILFDLKDSNFSTIAYYAAKTHNEDMLLWLKEMNYKYDHFIFYGCGIGGNVILYKKLIEETSKEFNFQKKQYKFESKFYYGLAEAGRLDILEKIFSKNQLTIEYYKHILRAASNAEKFDVIKWVLENNYINTLFILEYCLESNSIHMIAYIINYITSNPLNFLPTQVFLDFATKSRNLVALGYFLNQKQCDKNLFTQCYITAINNHFQEIIDWLLEQNIPYNCENLLICSYQAQNFESIQLFLQFKKQEYNDFYNLSLEDLYKQRFILFNKMISNGLHINIGIILQKVIENYDIETMEWCIEKLHNYQITEKNYKNSLHKSIEFLLIKNCKISRDCYERAIEGNKIKILDVFKKCNIQWNDKPIWNFKIILLDSTLQWINEFKYPHFDFDTYSQFALSKETKINLDDYEEEEEIKENDSNIIRERQNKKIKLKL